MALGYANLFEVSITSVMSHQESGNPGRVSLESEHHHIHHELHMLRVVLRLTLGSSDTGVDRSE